MSASGDLRLHQIDAGVHLYRGYFSNSAVLITDGGVLVVDTQVSLRAAARLRTAIRRVTTLPVAAVVNTHYHGDHVGGNGAFPGVPIHGSDACGRFVIERDAERFEYARTFGLAFHEVPPAVAPTHRHAGPVTLTFGRDRVDLLQLGRAETPDALLVHWPERGVVACGDAVATCDYPFLGVPFLDEGLRDDGEWTGLLDRLIALRPRVLLPGHGPALVGEATIAARLRLLRQLFGELLAVTREEMAAGGSVGEQVARIDARLAHYRRRGNLAERTVSQRFAIYRCLNNLDERRRGRGWWANLRPSVVPVADLTRGERLLARVSRHEASRFDGMARVARRLVRRARLGEALALVLAYERARPRDARGPGLRSELLLAGARRVRPTVDATELVAAALAAARVALGRDPDEPHALLTLGCAEVFGAMVLAQPMAPGVAKIEAALASGMLPPAEHRKGHFFLGKALQMEDEDGAADYHYRRALPGWARPLYPLLRGRLRRYP